MMTNKFLLIISVVLTVAFGLSEVQNTEAALENFLNFASIPEHPLLKKIEEQKSIINGAQTKTIIYKAENSLDIPRIVDFYKDVLMQRGWKKSQEYLTGDYSIVGFTDDEFRVFTVVARKLPFTEGVIVNVFYIPGGMKSWIFKDSPEDNDMPGSELSWFPRYPGANRMQSVEDYTGITKIDYIIIGYNCIDCVKEFYKEHMLKNGWQLINSDHQNKDQIKDNLAENASRIKELFAKLGTDKNLKDKNIEIDLDSYDKYLNSQSELPSEIYSFHFEKKNDMCEIGISYKETQEGPNMAEQMNRLAGNTGEVKEEDKLKTEEFLSKVRPYYYQSQGNKEAVMVSVIYMPKAASYSSKKPAPLDFNFRGE